MKNITKALALLGMAALPVMAFAGANEDAVKARIDSYLPGVTGFGTVKVENLTVDNNTRTVKVALNEAAAYIPLTAAQLGQLKTDIARTLGKNGYDVTLTADGRNLDALTLFAPKTNLGPTETERFIVRQDAAEAPAGLDGANIALWQSHGWYFEPKLNRWEWQRARIFQTVEDLYTQSYVMPFLMPMLENAGAYVMSPRERDVNTTEIIVDNDGALATGIFEETGRWSEAGPGFAHRNAVLHNTDRPFAAGTSRKAGLSGSENPSATAKWNADIPEDGTYAVYVAYTTQPNSTTAANYRVNAANGTHKFTVNQKMGGGTWIYLGHFPLEAGRQTVVELDNAGSDTRSVVSADAVKIGGGMGNVARIVKTPKDSIDYNYTLSGYPRFVEGARYFLQWAGAPDSVFTPTNQENDYTDDYRSRGLWVNWLTGGSSMLPDREGLNIPVDLSFAFHSDAGTTMNDSIIGTLGIYCTAGDTLGNGSNRLASRDLTNLVMDEIVGDVRASFEPNWTRRGMWDRSYYEARVPEVPAMLLELLSHQNFADMAYGLDPTFRFTVSRAVYKGMLRFLAQRDGREYVVTPLPVRSFAITSSGRDKYRLSWAERVDSLEETATPTYYIVEERTAAGGYRRIGTTESTHYDLTITDSDIHSYRIVAANRGGVAFPSEVLSLCNKPGKTVTIVNGFTRVSAPDRFDSGDIAGFYDVRDHGVPYMQDMSFIGSQFEFRRDIPWMDDDAAGFGASRADYEDKVVAGNTFDYPYIHGQAIATAGYGFVSTSVEAFVEATDTPAMVDLILGKQKEYKTGTGSYGTHFKAFPGELQNRMADLAGKGTAFFVSGSYVATDIWDNPYSDEATAEADKAFARSVLGFNWRVGQASVEGEAYEVDSRFRAFNRGNYEFANTLNDEMYAVESPDSFYPADPETGATILRYTENNLVAGTAMVAPTHRAVVIGFPFETIKDTDSRNALMDQILAFFTDPQPVRTASSHAYTAQDASAIIAEQGAE